MSSNTRAYSALEFDELRVVDESVENSFGDDGVRDGFEPLVGCELGCLDDGDGRSSAFYRPDELS